MRHGTSIRNSFAAFAAAVTAVGLCLVIFNASSLPAEAATPGGITVTPATVTLRLASGQKQQQASMYFTNHYATPAALHFALEQPLAAPGGAPSGLKQLSIASPDITLAAGASVQQTVTLADSSALAPGSQQAELVVTQTATPGSNVSVVPSIRLPLVLIKEDGAVASLSGGQVGAPAFAWQLPEKLNFTISNSGNIIAIPRGYLAVTDPAGRTVSKGVLNTGSAAVAPGGRLQLSTTTVSLARAWLPGVYHVSAVYGLGGGQGVKTASFKFWYVPLWEVVLLAALVALGFVGRRLTKEWLAHRSTRRPIKTLAGKGTA